MTINLATKPNDLNLYKYYMDEIKKLVKQGIDKSRRDKSEYVLKITLEKVEK
jgi:hypothetical protein